MKNITANYIFYLFVLFCTSTIADDVGILLDKIPPLTKAANQEKQPAAEYDLIKIMQSIESTRHERAARSNPFVTKNEVNDIYGFTVKYRSCETAATGRLYLAVLIRNEGRYESFQEVLPVLNNIQTTRSDSWQAQVAAILLNGERIRQAEKKSSEEQRKEYEVARILFNKFRSIAEVLDQTTIESIILFKEYFARAEEGNLLLATLRMLGHINTELGNIDEARENYLEIIRLYPDSTKARIATSQLGKLMSHSQNVTVNPQSVVNKKMDADSKRERRSAVLKEDLGIVESPQREVEVKQRIEVDNRTQEETGDGLNLYLLLIAVESPKGSGLESTTFE